MANNHFARITHSIAAPTGSNTVVLFSTVTAFPGGNYFAATGIHRFLVNVVNSHSATLKGYRSADRGVTWTQVSSDALSAPSAGTSNRVDLVVEPFADWKLEWVNGGSDQTTWVLDMAMIDERGATA